MSYSDSQTLYMAFKGGDGVTEGRSPFTKLEIEQKLPESLRDSNKKKFASPVSWRCGIGNIQLISTVCESFWKRKISNFKIEEMDQISRKSSLL